MIVVQEREHAVVLLVRDWIKFVGVALRALHGEPENPFADGFHSIELRIHAELLRINPTLFIEHGVAQETGGDKLIFAGIVQQITGKLLDDKPVVGKVAIEC
jgi:hypothetical protein